MSTYNYDLKGVNALLELGKNGITLDASNGYIQFLMPDGTTVAPLKLPTAVSDEDAVNLGQLNSSIQTAINALVNGAPETLDTLKELADWVDAHQDLYEALVTNVNAKLDASKVVTDINALAGNVPDAPTVKSYVDTKFSEVETGCRDLEFSTASASEVNIGSFIPAGTRIKQVTVRIETLFNDVAATLSIGNDSNHEAYMKNTDMNIQRAGIYDKVLLEKVTSDTQVKLYMSKGTATTGSGYLVIEHC